MAYQVGGLLEPAPLKMLEMLGIYEKVFLNIFWDTFYESAKKKVKKIIRSATAAIRKKAKNLTILPLKDFYSYKI